MIIKAYAAAKINLYLDITGTRNDGYHNIESVMCAVSLYDTVTLDFDNSGFYMITDGVSEPMEQTNTVLCAIRRFEAALTESELLHMLPQNCSFSNISSHVDKRIPAGAGLGGGSADAAAVLLLLNRCCGEPFDTNKLYEIGRSVGADVPFCITGGITSCTGTGEILKPLHCSASPEIVIVIGDSRVSTAWAYSEYDKLASCITERGNFIDFIGCLENNGDISTGLYNVFESVVFMSDPTPRILKQKLLTSGASAALMSGSGPAVFGLFDSSATAECAYKKLIGEGYKAYRCAFDKK